LGQFYVRSCDAVDAQEVTMETRLKNAERIAGLQIELHSIDAKFAF
jgi:hypothetical protein